MKLDRGDNALEDIPQCGAIFMASISTKKECLKRRVLALPSSKAHFVKQIKAGMLLFLFEYEKRQLYGVFQATTDGAMDIVPDGFHYPGRHFPAQVRFKPVWKCHPLNEGDFRGSIRDNYFAPYKFKLGLTEVQVRSLLSVFSSRKIKKLPPRVRKEVTDKVLAIDNSELGAIAHKEDNEHNPALLSDHQMDSLIRPNGVVNGEGEVYSTNRDFLSNYHDDIPKRRRLDYDNVLLKSDKDHGILKSTCTDSTVDPLEVRRPVDSQQSFINGKVYEENQMYNKSNHAIRKYPKGLREASVMPGNQFNGSYLDYGSELSRTRHAVDENINTSLNNVLLDGEFEALDSVKPMVPSDHKSKLAQAMSRFGDHPSVMNEEMENRYEGIPVSSTEPLSNLLHAPRTTAGGMFPNAYRTEDAYDFVTSVIASVSKKILPQLDRERTLHDKKVRFDEARATDDTLDSFLCPPNSSKDAVCISSTGRGSDRRDDIEVNHGFVGPTMSKYSSSNPKQLLSSSSDIPLPETGISHLPDVESYDPSHPGYDNATISRDAPYIPELPYNGQGCSGSAAVDNKSSVGQETHLYNGSLPNLYSLSGSSSLPLSFSPKYKRFMDVELAGGIKSSPTNSAHQSSLPCSTTPYFHNPNSPIHRAPNITSVEFDNSVLSRPPIGHENIDGGKSLDAYPSKSTENAFASTGHLQMASHNIPEHVPCNHMGNEDSSCLKDISEGSRHPARDISSYGSQYLPTSGDDNINEHHRMLEAPQSVPDKIRRSVFTRLTRGQDVLVSGHGNDVQVDSDDKYMDASADEVMEMLHQCNTLSLRKLNDSNLVVQSQHLNSDSVKNQILRHIDLNHSPVKENNMEDSHLGIAEPTSTGDVPEETRKVDFKRRSAKNKSSVRTKTDPVTDTGVTSRVHKVERPAEKTLKRKRLIRPVF